MAKDKGRPTIKVHISFGAASPQQKASWRKFWQKITADANSRSKPVGMAESSWFSGGRRRLR